MEGFSSTTGLSAGALSMYVVESWLAAHVVKQSTVIDTSVSEAHIVQNNKVPSHQFNNGDVYTDIRKQVPSRAVYAMKRVCDVCYFCQMHIFKLVLHNLLFRVWHVLSRTQLRIAQERSWVLDKHIGCAHLTEHYRPNRQLYFLYHHNSTKPTKMWWQKNRTKNKI